MSGALVESSTSSSDGGKVPPESSPTPTSVGRSTAVAVWVGLAITVLGFGLVAAAWALSAQELEVFRQTPYLMLGLSGLGLTLVGTATISIAARARDSRERCIEIEELACSLVQVRELFEERER